MIPDFKTFVGESVWSDIHRRSNGKQERAENGVNQLDLEGLCEYLNKIYDSFDPKSMIEINEDDNDKWLSVYIFEDTSGYFLSICYDGNDICLPYDMVSDFIDIDEVNMLFSAKLEKNNFDVYLLSFSSKKNGDVNNSLLIEVIDYVLSKVPNTFDKLIYKKTNESVWADIHRRSNGTQGRKEDNLSYINDMTVDDFIQFLRNEYPSTPEGKNTFISEWNYSNIIGFPIIIKDGGIPISIFLYNCKKGGKWIGINSSFEEDYPDIISIIKKKYKISWESRKTIKIYKDDPHEDITNLDFIKLIDYLLNNIKHYTLARKTRVDESVWADIHRRSNGFQGRKEDDINNFTLEELCDYLNEIYKGIRFDDKFLTGEDHNGCFLYAPLVPRYGIVLHITDNEEKHIVFNKKLEKEMPDFYNLIDSKYFITSCDFNKDLKCIYQSGEAKLKVDNKFYIEVLDFLMNKYNGTKRIKRI